MAGYDLGAFWALTGLAGLFHETDKGHYNVYVLLVIINDCSNNYHYYIITNIHVVIMTLCILW